MIVAAALFFGVVAPAFAQNLSIRVNVGFSGVVPVEGLWPVVLEITNTGADPVGMAFELGSTTFSFYGAPTVRRTLEVSAGAKKSVTLVTSGSETYGRGIELEFDAPQAVEFSGPAFTTFKTQSSTRTTFTFDKVTLEIVRNVIVALGGKARQLSQAAHAAAGVRADQRLLLSSSPVRIIDLANVDIPDNWLAWSAVKAIIWTDPEPEALGDPSQLRAIERFIDWGGTLVWATAQQPGRLDNAALQGILSGRVTKVERGNYGVFNGTRVDGPILDLTPIPGARLSKFSFDDRNQFARTERSYGRGTIVTLGADPFLLDLGDSERFVRAWRAATGLPIAFGMSTDHGENAMNFGYYPTDDSMGGPPWESFLINSNILRPPVGLLVLLAIGFVLLIGPIDYNILKSKDKLHWSPVTLLVYTTVFALICVVATFFVFAPREETNRVAVFDLVDGGDGTERIFGNVYWGVYAPLGGRYNLAPEKADEFEFYSRYAGRPDGGSSEIGRQNVRRSGFQPLGAELAFNSFRSVESLISGVSDGGFIADVRKTGPNELTVKIVNRFTRPLLGVVVSVDQQAFVDFGEVAAGATVEKIIVIASARDVSSVYGVDQLAAIASGRITKDAEVTGELATSIAVQGLRRKLGAQGIASGSIPEKFCLVVGVIRDLPFADTTTPESRGFTLSAVRRLVEIKDK